MNVGYGHSITELEMELISCLKSNKGFIIYKYVCNHNYFYDLLLFIVIYRNLLYLLLHYDESTVPG
jgi:hypothetical protein